MGAAPRVSGGAVVSTVQSQSQFQTTAAHGLSLGSAVSLANEIRFVTNVPSPSSLTLNAPFSATVSAGASLAPVTTYMLGAALPSLTLYDYWDPTTAVNRIITGAAVDTLQFSVNGDYHEFIFDGPAADVLDTTSFVQGAAGLSSFPAEPTLSSFDYSVVPGHLGAVWLGSGPANQFFTLTQAQGEIKNSIEVRNKEFGSSYPRAIAPGARQVNSHFTIYAQDDAQTHALYQAAKSRNTMPAMLQLGQQQGQLMAIFLPDVTPEIPIFNDTDTRLQWEFKNNRAQGSANDEIYVAFA